MVLQVVAKIIYTAAANSDTLIFYTLFTSHTNFGIVASVSVEGGNFLSDLEVAGWIF